MIESHVIGKGPCPKCRKSGRDTRGDNLVEYSDGHSFCFSCGFRSQDKLSKVYLNHKLESASGRFQGPKQPENLVEYIPLHYKRWLNKYQINAPLIEKYGIKYNETTSRIRFTLPEGIYRERYIEDPSKTLQNLNVGRVFHRPPKWYGSGRRSDDAAANCWKISGKYGTVVLVEDVVSGLRISELYKILHDASKECGEGNEEWFIASYPLLGVNINATALKSLATAFPALRVWLDRDKRDKALRIASRASQWCKDVRVICSEKDPKEYSDEEILSYIQFGSKL